jgi:hypothetical protein
MDTRTTICFLILCYIYCNNFSSIHSYVYYVRFNYRPDQSTSALTFIKATPNVVNFHKMDSDLTATRYGMDGPGIESHWRVDFRCPLSPTPTPTKPKVQWVSVLSRD